MNKYPGFSRFLKSGSGRSRGINIQQSQAPKDLLSHVSVDGSPVGDLYKAIDRPFTQIKTGLDMLQDLGLVRIDEGSKRVFLTEAGKTSTRVTGIDA